MLGQYASHRIDVRPNAAAPALPGERRPQPGSAPSTWWAGTPACFRKMGQAPHPVGVQTVDVPLGAASIFEVRLREPWKTTRS